MHTFTDSAGRKWTLAVNVTSIRRVKADTEVDLLGVLNGTVIDRLLNEPGTLADVLFSLAKDQAAQQSVSEADFGTALAGDAIDAATTALLQELSDFFPKGRRTILRKALEKVQEAEAAMVERGTQEIETAANREIQKIRTAPLADLLPPTPGGPATNSPARSEPSTPAPSPSAS